MNRPAVATAVLLAAALATAGCGGGQASSGAASSASSSSSSSAAAGTQGYASILDLYSAVLDAGTTCSDVTMQAAVTAKAQAGCDLGSGRSLALQIWRDSASRTDGVRTAATTLAAAGTPSCLLEGLGDKGLWSVSATGDPAVCTDLARHLGGKVTTSAAQG